ncbi:MAG: inverse autotransporter beta domain-containing protein [Chlamydiae bacterium]|nr:inverse autotransporter beta domain-containing protein [Chlamydiota bacterium]
MNPFLANTIAGSLLCFTAMAFTESAAITEPFDACPNGSKHYRASVRHIEGGGIGYDDGYTTLEGFFAPDPERLAVMPFLDLRGHVFDSGKMAANAGLGFRGIFGCRTYGLNTYYDYRNTKRGHYNQIGAGLETLGTLWDIRVNGYLPVGKKISAPYDAEFAAFAGNSMLVSQKYQFAMKGADAEMGFHFGKSRLFDFYAAAGPYYYMGEIGGNTWGGKGRIAGMFKEYVTFEVSDSYDRMFRNNFQCQLTLSIPFGGTSKVKKRCDTSSCKKAETLITRMVQPVGRQEIVVVGKARKNAVATDPLTGAPLFFVFVSNTSSSNGSYQSPYHTLAQAEANSGPGDIIYVFPGDGTTAGMDSGITLQADQSFWGSGTTHIAQTSQGSITIPAQTATAPQMTSTTGHAITLATNNAISGFTITSALHDAIYGADPQSLDVSFCTFENTRTYTIEASFLGDASISLTNNQFLNNINGVFLDLYGTSSIVCSGNTFQGQTSRSEIPLNISAHNHELTALIENNVFNANAVGAIRFNLEALVNADIFVLNNTITNNDTGNESRLGSSVVVTLTAATTTDRCSIVLEDNTFSGNGFPSGTSNALYLHTDGAFTNLDIIASSNTITNNDGGGIALATPVDTLTLQVKDNTMTSLYDNAIAVIASGATSTGNITISDNIITHINGTGSSGIVVNQDFSNLNLTIVDNEIDGCAGSGITCYSGSGIDSFTLNVSGNTISNCQNSSVNNSSGIDINKFISLSATIANNTLISNVAPSVYVYSDLNTPSVCLNLTGNNNDATTGYFFNNGSGTFNIAPCDYETVNTGNFTLSGTFGFISSCPDGRFCVQ